MESKANERGSSVYSECDSDGEKEKINRSVLDFTGSRVLIRKLVPGLPRDPKVDPRLPLYRTEENRAK